MAVADQLVIELNCWWGIPEMVSQREAAFRNRLNMRINQVFKGQPNRQDTIQSVKQWAGGEYNNSTPRVRLCHYYVESRQKDWNIVLPTVQLMSN